jgi:hypothetical protein
LNKSVSARRNIPEALPAPERKAACGSKADSGMPVTGVFMSSRPSLSEQEGHSRQREISARGSTINGSATGVEIENAVAYKRILNDIANQVRADTMTTSLPKLQQPSQSALRSSGWSQCTSAKIVLWR